MLLLIIFSDDFVINFPFTNNKELQKWLLVCLVLEYDSPTTCLFTLALLVTFFTSPKFEGI